MRPRCGIFSKVPWLAKQPTNQLKNLGFQEATQATISLRIDDLLTAPSKSWLIQDVEQQGYTLKKHHVMEMYRQ